MATNREKRQKREVAEYTQVAVTLDEEMQKIAQEVARNPLDPSVQERFLFQVRRLRIFQEELVRFLTTGSSTPPPVRVLN